MVLHRLEGPFPFRHKHLIPASGCYLAYPQRHQQHAEHLQERYIKAGHRMLVIGMKRLTLLFGPSQSIS